MTIEQAVALAAKWHDGQVDKAGVPYIYHLMRVCLAVEEEDRVPAVLHDILEDTNIPYLFLYNLLGSDDYHAVLLLTRQKSTSYEAYIKRIITSGNQQSLRIKRADLIDHLWNNPNRLQSEDQKVRYLSALDDIEEAINDQD